MVDDINAESGPRIVNKASFFEFIDIFLHKNRNINNITTSKYWHYRLFKFKIGLFPYSIKTFMSDNLIRYQNTINKFHMMRMIQGNRGNFKEKK